jgi:transcriptional regulator with XRE-family HTH domain
VDVGEVFVRRMTAVRKQRGWSARELEERVNGLGGEVLPRNTVAKLEASSVKARRKNLSLAEAVAISAALGVPFTLMLVPVEDGEEVEVLPGRPVQGWWLWEWMVHDAPLPVKGADRWEQGWAPAAHYENVQRALEAVNAAGGLRQDAEDQEAADSRFHGALVALHDAVQLMRRSGYAADRLVPSKFAKEMKERGIR